MTDLTMEADPDVDALALDGVLEIRAEARDRRTRATTGDQLYRLYLLAILTAPVAYLLVQALQQTSRADVATISPLLARATVVVPLVLLGAGVCGLRLAAWTGPVVVARADIAWIFSLPFPRQQLIRPRLGRAMIVAAVVTGIISALATVPYHVTVGLAPDAAAEAGRMALAAAVGGGLYGLALTGLGWIVETRQAAARALMRGSGIGLVVIVLALLASILGPVPPGWAQGLALASGPWGWMAAGILAGTSPAAVPVVAGLAGLGLLALTAAALAMLAWRRAGDVPLEELRRRAATSAQVTAAAVYFADFRSAAQARDRVVRALVGRGRRRLPMPRRQRLLVPWIGATVLLRQPRRVGQALLWLLGATYLAATAVAAAGDDDPSLLVLALIPLSGAVAYAAAGTLVEPLRVEIEQRFGIRMLQQPVEVMGLWHLVVPTVVLWLLGILAAAVMVAAGLVSPIVLVTAPLAWLVVSPGLVMVAGFVVSGPPADSGWLYTGESGLGRLALHLLRGPLVSAVLIGTPTLMLSSAISSGDTAAVVQSGASAAVWMVGLGIALARWTQNRLATNH